MPLPEIVWNGEGRRRNIFSRGPDGAGLHRVPLPGLLPGSATQTMTVYVPIATPGRCTLLGARHVQRRSWEESLPIFWGPEGWTRRSGREDAGSFPRPRQRRIARQLDHVRVALPRLALRGEALWAPEHRRHLRLSQPNRQAILPQGVKGKALLCCPLGHTEYTVSMAGRATDTGGD